MQDNEQMLIEYSKQFKTQGNRYGKYWFLGIEESGGKTVDDVVKMLEKWDRSGRKESTVLRDENNPSENDEWFGNIVDLSTAKIQFTWGAQIQILLSIMGASNGTDDIKRFQQQSFGTASSDTCLMELLPLPNPRINNWIYKQVSNKEIFSTRKKFMQHALKDRVNRFVELVEKHKPVSVVGLCYGQRHMIKPMLSSVEYIEANQASRPGKAMIGYIGDTVVAVTYHPSFNPSARNDWYTELGKIIAERSKEGDPQPRLPFAA